MTDEEWADRQIAMINHPSNWEPEPEPPPLIGPGLGWEGEMCVEDCAKHGEQEVMEYAAGPGFTGATIWWWTMRCGCGDADLSQDTIEAVR